MIVGLLAFWNFWTRQSVKARLPRRTW